MRISTLVMSALAFAAIVGERPVSAQDVPYNPLNVWQDPSGPNKTLPDGVWPVFYKPHKIDAKKALYYAMGWCRWKRDYEPGDMVDVNALPAGEYTGTVTSTAEGVLVAQQSDTPALNIIIHPSAKLSKVHVQGKTLASSIQPGRFVRFMGKVNEKGEVKEPVSALELFTPDAAYEAEELVPGSVRNITGRVLSQLNGKVYLKIETGKIRKVTLRLTESPEITANVTDYSLVSAGDQVTVKGKLYNSADLPAIFATDLEVKLAEPVEAPKKKGRAKISVAQR